MNSTLTPRLLIQIGGHFSQAPRPQKEAAAAIAAGFTVHVRGAWWDEGLAEEDLQLARKIGVDFRPVVDLRSTVGARGWMRIRHRLAKEAFLRFGLVTACSYGIGAPEMLREASRLQPALTMVHSEAGLWVADQLIKKGFRVGVDFEDWFSEDLPTSERRGRPVRQIKALERHLLRRAHLTLSPTRVMAIALAQDAGTERIPLVVPNCFPAAPLHPATGGLRDARDEKAVSFYWFSQTIGPGRGLESLAKALPNLCGPWELHLRGNLRGYDRWFEETFPTSVRSRVNLHPCVSNEELPMRSGSHDVGLALEVPYCLNKDFTASNKIFEYLRCGLAVIASKTKGQLEVMERCPEAGWVVPSDDAAGLGSAMQLCLDRPASLLVAKSAARRAGAEVWNWDSFAQELTRHLSVSIYKTNGASGNTGA
jgi:glycosyltransferase involved in cell wall biosynthesis